MQTETLLFEIGTEELPPKSLKSLAQALASGIEQGLTQAQFPFEQVQWLAAPRRLAVRVTQLANQQPDRVVEKRGPAISAAFDAEGNPTKAALGWARGNGIDIEQAERLVTDKGEWLLHKAHIQGQSIDALFFDIAAKAIKQLPIPKPMRWGSSDTQFVRPVHTLCVLLGDQVLPGELLGLTSGRTVQGHRFMGEARFEIDSADSYAEQLETQGKVIVDFDKRQQLIARQIEAAAQSQNGQVAPDQDLLDEVTAIVDWPTALIGRFDEAFLQVPNEALIYTIKDNQRYFPLQDQHGQLMPSFVFISNVESIKPEVVVSGNEKVVRPRLEDAKFFFEQDKRFSLESRLTRLEKVVFEKTLGTQAEKSHRVAALAQWIATQLSCDAQLAHRAGLLAKCDLTSEMVGEIPEVQGIMGSYYALHDGEDPQVAQAIEEQYRPRFSGDDLPKAPLSLALALADKLDTLVGIFAIGRIPKGDKDPYALRRAAIGIARLLIEPKLPISVSALLTQSAALLQDKADANAILPQIRNFIEARLKAWYQEKGYAPDSIQAVLATPWDNLSDLDARLRAVEAFRHRPEVASLAAANKRISNILAKNELDLAETWQTELFEHDSEQTLAQLVLDLKAQAKPLLAEQSYEALLDLLAQLKTPVDTFFDHVMVMADDPKVRANRLSLLNQLRALFLTTADISLIQS